MTNLHNDANLSGEDHPIIDAALEALGCFGDMDRAQAAKLLDMWQDRDQLSDRDRAAVLDRFPEGDDPDPYTFSTLVEAFRVGQVLGKRYAEKDHDETIELIQRLDRRLKAAAAGHAFTVTHIAGAGLDDWLWTCTCGEQVIQLEGETVDALLIAHARREAGR